MRRVFAMAVVLATSACASGPSLAHATSLHNQTKHTLESIDRGWAPVYAAAAQDASDRNPDSTVAFHEAIAPCDRIDNLINEARQAEQITHLAVSQWQSFNDGGGMLGDVAVCVQEALEHLADEMPNIPAAGLALRELTMQLAQQYGSYAGRDAICEPNRFRRLRQLAARSKLEAPLGDSDATKRRRIVEEARRSKRNGFY